MDKTKTETSQQQEPEDDPKVRMSDLKKVQQMKKRSEAKEQTEDKTNGLLCKSLPAPKVSFNVGDVVASDTPVSRARTSEIHQ